ncbi:MAG: RpiB/LacA/LacB family sugar-phosphate isomerase [Acidimicrobiales bacterium]
MRIAFGTDEQTPLTDAMRAHLKEAGHQVLDVATGEEWPEVGRAVGEAVASGSSELGVVCCYTGTGVAMAANKVKGVRAALCTDASTAAGARRWNDSNVLAVGLRLSSRVVAAEMLDAFISTRVDETERAAIARLESP